MQSILKEVESVKSFTKTRDGLPGGVNDVVLQGMVTSIIKQVNAIRSFGAQEATWLSLALTDSPYGEAGTQKMAQGGWDAGRQVPQATPQQEGKDTAR